MRIAIWTSLVCLVLIGIVAAQQNSTYTPAPPDFSAPSLGEALPTPKAVETSPAGLVPLNPISQEVSAEPPLVDLAQPPNWLLQHHGQPSYHWCHRILSGHAVTVSLPMELRFFCPIQPSNLLPPTRAESVVDTGAPVDLVFPRLCRGPAVAKLPRISA